MIKVTLAFSLFMSCFRRFSMNLSAIYEHHMALLEKFRVKTLVYTIPNRTVPNEAELMASLLFHFALFFKSEMQD